VMRRERLRRSRRRSRVCPGIRWPSSATRDGAALVADALADRAVGSVARSSGVERAVDDSQGSGDVRGRRGKEGCHVQV
jgi:hypothetical protein